MKLWGLITLERVNTLCIGASHASEENFVKNKSFMLLEGILERILQNKPCFKFRKHLNTTNSLSV